MSSAVLRYGGETVLDQLNMMVRRGDIYGLLGASGCGKTSLLSLLVGRRSLTGGSLSVLGAQPGERGSGVPGRRVGYMPQELALYQQFTILETFFYFGRINKMSSTEIKTRVDFLRSLLELPPDSRTVGTLSGGQQRRVSLSVSLLHDPELLILDEPTVGLDPLLRQKIWSHLLHLADVTKKTVIITTHYIEEARHATVVGLMRSGQLLAQEGPGLLLAKHGASSLDEVFTKLCIRQDSRMGGGKEAWQHSPSPALLYSPVLDPLTSKDCKIVESTSCGPSSVNLWALLVKNFLKIKRNIPMLLFVFLLPAMQVVFFCIAVGQTPAGLRLGVVNLEVEDLYTCQRENISEVAWCDLSLFSCKMFKSDETVELIEYSSEDKAYQDVVEGHIWGYLNIPENFTTALISKFTGGFIGNNSAQVSLDMSNYQIGVTLRQWLGERVNTFTELILEQCGLSPDLASSPVTFSQVIYGEREPRFTEFMAPGIIIIIIYFLAVALTGEAFITERSTGLLERSRVAGVRPSEILASHIMTQCGVMVIQTAITLAFILLVFKIPCNGPVLWLAVITLLQGLAGMSFGFFISSLCDTEALAMQLSIGSFYPCLLLSGILWPLEGMPYWLQTVARLLPNTLACQAMRDIMLRGWDIVQQDVYLGVN